MSQHVKRWAGPDVAKARKEISQRGFANDEPCVICEQPIDYRLPWTEPDGMTIQHIKPRSTHPHLTWDRANMAPAHAQCNNAAKNTIQSGLGIRNQKWS